MSYSCEWLKRDSEEEGHSHSREWLIRDRELRTTAANGSNVLVEKTPYICTILRHSQD